MTRYVISLDGCDDNTTLVKELTVEQYEFLSGLSEELNAASKYGCQPQMKIMSEKSYKEKYG